MSDVVCSTLNDVSLPDGCIQDYSYWNIEFPQSFCHLLTERNDRIIVGFNECVSLQEKTNRDTVFQQWSLTQLSLVETLSRRQRSVSSPLQLFPAP